MAARRFWPNRPPDDPEDAPPPPLSQMFPGRQVPKQSDTGSDGVPYGRPNRDIDMHPTEPARPFHPSPSLRNPVETDSYTHGPDEYSQGGAVRKAGSDTHVPCKDKFAR